MSKLETISIQYQNHPLSLYTQVKVSTKLWENIYNGLAELVQTYHKAFGLDATHSSLAAVHELEKNVPQQIQPELAQYLRLLIKLFTGHESLRHGSLGFTSLADFSLDGDVFIKKKDIKISAFLSGILLLQEAQSLVSAAELANYHLNWGSYHFAAGNKGWRISLEHPTQHTPLYFELENSWLCYTIRKISIDSSISQQPLIANPFAKVRHNPEVLGIILTADSALDCFVFSNQVTKFDFSLEVKKQLQGKANQVWVLTEAKQPVQIC